MNDKSHYPEAGKTAAGGGYLALSRLKQDNHRDPYKTIGRLSKTMRPYLVILALSLTFLLS